MAINEMIEEIKKLTVVELNDLVKAIEEEFGVSAVAAAAPVDFRRFKYYDIKNGLKGFIWRFY